MLSFLLRIVFIPNGRMRSVCRNSSCSWGSDGDNKFMFVADWITSYVPTSQKLKIGLLKVGFSHNTRDSSRALRL